ncbi:MAG: MBL fold metallo-hydrolase, partial [Gammaproteobacteria bacterium]|nr:MBL fold metallo-hydrolase [Gammaproteobacteria bacterium]
MIRTLLIALSIALSCVGTVSAQDAQSALRAAARAMGTADLDTVEFTGSGWYGQVGQSYVLDGDWPRFEVFEYTRVIDYDAGASREDLHRRRGSFPAVGGGAPFAGDQLITEVVADGYAWNIQGDRAARPGRPYMDGVAHADFRYLDILLTPHGFIKAALDADDATAITLPIANESNVGLSQDGREVTVVSFTALDKYRVNGTINDQDLIEIVSTWVPNPVYGDMLFEMRYTEYGEFDGVLIPTRLHEHQGDPVLNPAHNSLDIRISDVRINPDMPDFDVPSDVRNAQAAGVNVDSQEVADGVWRIAGGSHHSVLIEFEDFVTVVEAPLNEARSLAVIEEIGRLVPGKPIRYVVNTHHHFDHSGGLRTYLAQGAVIVTHEGNREFYEDVLFHPGQRSLAPDRLATYYPMFKTSRRPAPIEGVNREYVISDGSRTLEVHPVAGNAHTQTMVIAYLPNEKILMNADMYNAGAPVQSFRLPNMRTLAANIERLGLDVEQHVTMHARTGTHDEFLA